MDRNAFFARIREATSRGRSYRAEINPQATEKQSYVGGGDDPVASLIREWEGAGGRGHRVADHAQARAFVRRFLEQYGIRSLLRWEHPVLDRLDVESVCEAIPASDRGTPNTNPGLKTPQATGSTAERWPCHIWRWREVEALAPAARQTPLFSAELGITSVHYAVAETGTLALCAGPGTPRLASLLPPLYLAVVEKSQIVPDLFDLFAALEPQKSALPSTINLVTGPSKTGDIEMKLTTGVHGPGEVHLLVIG